MASSQEGSKGCEGTYARLLTRRSRGTYIFLRHRKVSSVPAAAQRLDERHAGSHAPARNLDGNSLIGERNALRGDDFKIGSHAAFVAVGRELERVLCRGNGCVLRLSFVLQQAQRSETVFNFLKCSQHRLAIICNRLIVNGARLIVHGPSSSSIEDSSNRRSARRDESAGTVEPVRDGCAFETSRGTQRDGWKIRCPRNANLRVRRRHTTLVSSDIRTPLQQFRGHSNGNNRRSTYLWRYCQSESRHRLPGQHGNRMLELRPLHTQINSLSPSRLQLRLGLRHVDLRHDSAVVPVARQFQRFFVSGDRRIQQLRFRIQGA